MEQNITNKYNRKLNVQNKMSPKYKIIVCFMFVMCMIKFNVYNEISRKCRKRDKTKLFKNCAIT